jgi:hypothetical protein
MQCTPGMSRGNAPGAVLLLSNNRDTQKGLREYFAESGVPCEARGTLNPLSQPAEGVRALVVFPDDFGEEEVTTYLSVLRARRPRLTMVVITRQTSVYDALVGMDGRPIGAVVLARPAFGWTILDVVRDVLARG